MVTGIVHDLDSGNHVMFVNDEGRWHPLAASTSKVARAPIHYYDGEDYTLPIEIEGDLNRARDYAMQRAKATRQHSTVSNQGSTIDTKA